MSEKVVFRHEKTTDQGTDCDTDWCDGPDSDTLSCFDCSDPSREYGVETGE